MLSTSTALLYCILAAAVVMLLLLCTAAPPPARLAVLPAIPTTTVPLEDRLQDGLDDGVADSEGGLHKRAADFNSEYEGFWALRGR